VVNLLRVVSIVLVLAAVALAVVPLVVIFDLAGGGDGLGLCPGGLDRCRNPYTAAPELAFLLTVGLFVVLGGLRMTQRALRRTQRRRREG
jgi:hypothetical protein